MAKPRRKLSFERACAILHLHYGYVEHGVTKISYEPGTNVYTIVKNNKNITHTEGEVLALAPVQKLSKVEKGMYAHWFSVGITDDDKAATKMLNEYLKEHPKTRIEGFYRKYDTQTFTKYFRLVSEESYRELGISFDTGYSPIHYCKSKPSNIFKIKADVGEWIEKYTQKTA